MSDLRSQARRLARASVGQAASTLWSALLGLFTAPFLLHHLGAPSYGVFALVTLVSSYLVNLEFGFGHATIRFLARAHAAEDLADEQSVISNSLLVFLPATAVTFALVFFGAPFIVQHFAHGPSSLHHTFVVAIRLASVIVATSFLSNLWAASLQALSRLNVLIKTNWIVGTLLSISSVVIAAAGGRLLDILRAQLVIQSVGSLVLLVAFARATRARLLPGFDGAKLREMGSYAGHTFLAGVGSQLLLQGPPAILAGYATTAELAAFSIPRTVMQQLDNLLASTSLAFLPFASAQSMNPDLSQLRVVFKANMRFTILVLAPAVCFVAAFAHPILVAWIGEHYGEKMVTPLRLFAGSSFFWALGAPLSDVARGLGRPAIVSAYTLIGAALTIGLAFAAVPSHGASGAAFAFCVGGAVINLPYVFLVVDWTLDIKATELARALATPFLAFALAAAIATGGLVISDSFVSAIATAAVGAALYIGFAATLVLDDRERSVLRSVVRREVPSSG